MLIAFWMYQYACSDLDCLRMYRKGFRIWEGWLCRSFPANTAISYKCMQHLKVSLLICTRLTPQCSVASPHPHGFVNGPNEGWVPFSDLCSQQLWAVGLGGGKGKFYAAAFFSGSTSCFAFPASCLGWRLELLMKGLSEGLCTLLEMNMNMIGPHAGSNVYY